MYRDTEAKEKRTTILITCLFKAVDGCECLNKKFFKQKFLYEYKKMQSLMLFKIHFKSWKTFT